MDQCHSGGSHADRRQGYRSSSDAPSGDDVLYGVGGGGVVDWLT